VECWHQDKPRWSAGARLRLGVVLAQGQGQVANWRQVKTSWCAGARTKSGGELALG